MQEKLQKLLDKTVDGKTIFGAVLCVETSSERFNLASGDMNHNRSFFIASTTKLYTTALIFQLAATKKLGLDDRICTYLDPTILDGIHDFKGISYASEITIRQLLSHTSGLPDYFEQKDDQGKILLEEIIEGRDAAWSFEQIITLAKRMRPKFRPGAKNKAFYSDTNFQLLGKIIEVATGSSFDDVLKQNIFEPLRLQATYMYRDISDTRPHLIHYKKKLLNIPKAMSSFGPDGGIVSTADEVMIFLKAFYEGELFPKVYIQEAQVWNPLFFPLEYGVGMMRFKLPWIFSPFKPFPTLIGHSGLSDAFAFYCPEKEIFMAGTVNQLHNPGRSFKLMLKVLKRLDS